jgi:hypothetical protein
MGSDRLSGGLAASMGSDRLSGGLAASMGSDRLAASMYTITLMGWAG